MTVPAHPPILGVIIYVTATGAVTVLSSDSLISAVLLLLFHWLSLLLLRLVHAKVAPAVELDGCISPVEHYHIH